MARTLKSVWLVSAALIVAACGGGDDAASPDPGTVAPDAAAPTGTDGADDGSVAVDEPAAPTTGSDDAAVGDGGDSGAATDMGPALEPAATFAGPASFAPVGYSIAVSPTGDRVALMWVDDSAFQTNLAIHDAASGDVLVSITDEQLDGDVLWTSDDRIITFGNFGELLEWDSGTLDFVSEIPLVGDGLECSAGNGWAFDPGAGALFLKSDSLCRIDVATGETAQYGSETRTTLLAVAIGGNEVYLRGTDDAGELVLRVLDAATLEVVSDEPSDGPNPIVAASANGTVAQESGGFGYLVQPSGRVVDFYTAGIATSAGGGYYVAEFDGGRVVISSSDGSSIGTIPSDRVVLRTAWSPDDGVMAAFTDQGVSVYRFG
jgi:hypothetical protein